METIFISIASYRDRLCSQTLENLYKNAKFPQRIYVGICEQNKDSDVDCLSNNFKWRDNIRLIKKDYKEAKGPTWARFLCSTLYRNEDFFLQIDAHTLFVKDWDEKCIQMVHSLENSSEVENKKVLLSHYPPQISDYKENPSDENVTHMVECFFNDEGLISFKGAQWRKPGPLPRRNAFIAGGFIFCRGSWIKDVPFDPYLDYLFVGEEILLSARSYTSGWDVYTPNKNIIYHAYTRDNEPKFWSDNSYNSSEAKEKAKIILQLEHDLSKLTNKKVFDSIKKYNCGNVRSLQDFYDFIGIDIRTKTVGKPKIEFFTLEGMDSPTPERKHFLFLCLLLLCIVCIYFFRCYAC
tara:strand:- start:61 stop:1113 length:1053 start_codon:yes stop_codon:yes gene_type:complete